MRTLIVDIDGTLSDASHRLHFLEGEKKDWNSFYKGLIDDKVHQDILNLIWNLSEDSGYKIVMCTGRPVDYKELTLQWFDRYDVPCDDLYMRPSGDYRQDYEVKLEMLEQVKKDGYDPYIILEDRDQVVKAFREKGYRVFQVTNGSY